MLKGLSAEKTMLAFTFLFFIVVLFVVFWFTRIHKQKDIYILTGSFYISAPIDTLTVFPVFESFINNTNPDLIIVEELLTPSLDLLSLVSSDSFPGWYNELSVKFRDRINAIQKNRKFRIKC